MKVYNRKGDIFTSLRCPYTDCPSKNNDDEICWNEVDFPSELFSGEGAELRMIEFTRALNKQAGMPEEKELDKEYMELIYYFQNARRKRA
jgi:hypothetical protein